MQKPSFGRCHSGQPPHRRSSRYAPSTPALRTVCRRLSRSDALYLSYRVPHIPHCRQLDCSNGPSLMRRPRRPLRCARPGKRAEARPASSARAIGSGEGRVERASALQRRAEQQVAARLTPGHWRGASVIRAVPEVVARYATGQVKVFASTLVNAVVAHSGPAQVLQKGQAYSTTPRTARKRTPSPTSCKRVTNEEAARE